MFKIESYITPIIINYIDKYVKDFRPQNAQVSLWGGEVSFQNLDIRLDILQQELHLPLNIVSGHIHELTIRVPWTKIASEPIQINVNTIEFVVKLKSEDAEKKEKEVKHVTPSQIVQEPPGYMATLINKIANNISIKLNNIIFKYIEDDIVLSMNIQMLSIDSADDNWNPAFIDINPVKVALKKVININDLTICLDKRNAQGKIDVCQEPILYRCSLQARMIRKYNLATAHLDSHTRIDIFTDNIDFKISVQQFPMLIRIYLLVQMLREFHTSLQGKARAGIEVALGNNQVVENFDSSYTTWIWNMIPEIFPQSTEEESIETHGHIIHNGFYAKNINITLKSQEIVSGNIIQTNTTYKYHPILKIALSGVSFDTISIGKNWTNLRGGVSYIGVFPMGNCTCGKKHNLPTIFLSGRKIKGEVNTFLLDSLKDPNCCENQNQNRLYETDFQSHMLLNTEDALLSKSPALTLDIVNYRQVLDDAKSYGSHSISSRDYDSITEEYFMRIIFGKMNLKIDTSLLHLYQTLNDQYEQYTYIAPYLVTNTPDILSQLTPPSTEDYESLLDCIPLRKCYVFLNKTTVEYYHLNSDHLQASEVNEFKLVPYLMCNLNRTEVAMSIPLYPEKLINTTCQLPDPTEKLKESCFNRMTVAFDQISVDVIFNKHRFNILHVLNAKLSYDTLIQPELWKMIKMQSYTFQMNVSDFRIALNKPQFMLTIYLIESISSATRSVSIRQAKALQSIEVCQSNLPKLEVRFNNFRVSVVAIDSILGIKSNLRSIIGLAYAPNMLEQESPENSYKCKTIFFTNEQFDADLLNCTIQYPTDSKMINHPLIVHFELQKTLLSFDELFQQFLTYDLPKYENGENTQNPEEKTQRKVRKSSKVGKTLLRTESVHSNSVTTLSLVTSANKAKDHDKQQLIKWYDLVEKVIVYVDVKAVTVYCPNKSLFMHQEACSLQNIIRNTKNVQLTSFRLPNLAIQSSKFKNIQGCLNNSFPISLTEVWMRNITGFPWNIELNNFSCETLSNKGQRIFLPSVNTKLTLDLTSKQRDHDSTGEEISFVIHLDTTPIAISLDLAQMKQIYEAVTTIQKLVCRQEKKAFNPLVEVPTTVYDAQINDFICETTNSEKSSEEIVSETDKHMSKVNCLMQWTITKFTVSFVGSQDVDNIELLVELEDIITSVDRQSAYIKVKTKFGSFNGLRKKRNKVTGEMDVLNIISRSDALTADSQETFFEMVATTAIASNVHSRWGATTKKALGFRDGTETITEILITMQSIDLKVELDVFTVILEISNDVQSTTRTSNQDELTAASEHRYSVKDLPLVFFDCKGFQLWLPNINENNPTESDVLILKINEISITPSVENPIPRKPIREDIYVKAAQLRMINTPGSIIEDRQYELLFKKVSIVTGNWNEIIQFTHPANNENPAFDWNNQTEKPALNVNTIFKDFVVSVIFAPAIIFQSIVVCGHALELNCVNDLSVNLTLNDVDLLNKLRLSFMNVFGISCAQPPNGKRQMLPQLNSPHLINKSTVDQFDNHLSDSGFKSNFNPEKSKSSEKSNVQKKYIPYAWSFVGGLFSMQLYDKNRNVDKPIPMFSIKMKQPNLFIVQDAIERVEQISLYNLSANLYDQAKFEETDNEFCDVFFETRQGELDDTGISPTLFELKKITNHNAKDTKIQCNMRKPIQLQFTPNNVDKLLGYKKIIENVLYGSIEMTDANNSSNKNSIVRYNKIKAIRKLIGESSNIEFNVTKFSVNFMTSTNCLLSLALFRWNSKIDSQYHPEQINLITNINSVEINTESSMLLNPMAINFDCMLSQEKWNKQLVIMLNFSSNVIDLQISPNDILTFAKIQVDFMNCINRHFNLKQCGDQDNKNHMKSTQPPNRFNSESLHGYDLPIVNYQNAQNDEEYFQDDLRLGTFEYIIANVENASPLPYQIYLINGTPNMQICWRYPHPRTIKLVHIYPIPGQIEVNAIKCRLEYFQESHNTFFPYVLFDIDSKKTSEVKLPKRRLTASVWRIVLVDPLASSSDIDLDEIGLNDILNPRTIIGCIRIDSMFSIKNVPKMQANVKINKLSMSILNNVFVQRYQPPEVLQRYTLKLEEHVDITQEFCQINFQCINANVNLYADMQAKIYSEFSLGVNVFDASYLTMIPLIDNISIASYIDTNTDNRPNFVHLTADKLSVRYGPAAGYALTTAKNVWQNMLNVDSQKPIMARFIICNSTSVPLKFGQVQTDEAIWLQSNECFYYAFRTQKAMQKLQFSVKSDDSIVEVADTYPLNEDDDMKALKVANNKLLLITSRKLSTTQRQIIIKGQIELMNMSRESFQIHYRNKNLNRDLDSEMPNGNQSVTLLPATSSASFFEACDDSSEAFIRLQLANENSNGWSGEIPLSKTTIMPWLVKVPSKSEQKFVTFSVRIHAEYHPGNDPINQRAKRFLIVIWPFFTVRSLMPMHLTAADREFNKNYTLQGKGGCIDVQIAGTFDTEHEFSFNLGQDNENLAKTILTYKNIDKKSFFAIPSNFKCIDDIVKELEKPDELKWPCSRETEINIDRKVSLNIPVGPLYKFSASRTLSCAMKLDIVPSCLFINNLGYEIVIINSTNNSQCTVQSNNIAIPIAIENAFCITLKCDDELITSSLVALTEKRLATNLPSVYLPDEGTIVTEIITKDRLIKICLTSVRENGIRTISVSSLYVICNFSKSELKYHAFCIHKNEKLTYDDVVKFINEKSALKPIPNNIEPKNNVFKGCECSTFCDISQKCIKSTNNLKDFNFYLAIGQDNRDFSAPILLNKPLIRSAFGIQIGEKSISLAASITQYKEQFYVSVYDDRFPFIDIDNRTNIEIFVAEADFADFSKSLKPKKSMHDENFNWHCTVPPYSGRSYAPPSINERFPEKQTTNVHLIFGCGNSKLLPGGKIQWSIPVETNKADKKYLALPLYGDIKITSSISNKTVKILLEHIDFKKEFNVKVVHTKLSSPNSPNVVFTGSIPAEKNDSAEKPRSLQPKEVNSKCKSSFRNFNANVFIKEVNLVLYDDDKISLFNKINIASLLLDDFIVCYSEEERKLEIGFGDIQVDNHLYSTGKYDFPVILCSQNSTRDHVNESTDKVNSNANSSEKCASKYESDLPTPFSLPLIKHKYIDNQLGNFTIIMEESEFSPKEIICSLQPLRVYVEDKFIAVLLDFSIENLPINIIYVSDGNESSICDGGQVLVPKFITEQILSFLSEPLRLNRICIKPLSILLSVHTCMRMYIALDHSPLHFAQFEHRNVYTTTMRLGYNIGMHYVSDAIFGAGWVVGSLEILGSPSGLARSVSTGLWDFVSMPVQGLMRGPWGVLLGITYGSASLIKNITAGTVNSVTKLAASVARNLDRLTLDDEHLERTEALRRTRPMGITHGLSQGLTGFGINLLGAVGGIARHALEAKSSVEVFTGIGKGLIGVVTKPISGAAELLALTGQGVLHTVGFNAMPISRNIETITNFSFPMSITKVSWKILSKIDYHDRVLTIASAALIESGDKSVNVTVAVTTKLILLMNDNNNDMPTVLSIARTRAAIDSKKITNLILTEKNDDESQQFHRKRILQYLSKAYIQSTEAQSNQEDEIQSNDTHETNRNILVFNDPTVASHLAKYIQFLYYCLNTSK